MRILVTSPADVPFGPLHPRFRYHGFREGGAYWSTIGQFVLAARLVDPGDRESVRMHARDPEHAEEMARSMPRLPDEDDRAREAARVAVARAFGQSIPLRAVLLATGDAPIEVRIDDPVLGVDEAGRGENALGRALVEARAALRARAEDEAAIQCGHDEAEEVRRACVHVLESRATPRRFCRAWTGRGAEHHLVCEACADAWPAAPPLRRVCADCFEGLHAGHRVRDVGEMEIRARDAGVAFAHRSVRLAGLDASAIAAIAPVARRASVFWALDREGAIFEIDLARGVATAGGRVDPGALDLAGPLVFVASPAGDRVAIGEAKARRAVLLDPSSGAETRRLERDDYHEDVSRFPLALVELGGRLVLVHGTAWNRLDACDARTGAPLTDRTIGPYEGDGRYPAHYLDYFHAALTPSPGGAFVVDDGWIWHPYGEVRVFDVRRFVEENPFESEDGPSLRALCGRSYFWDGPIAWVDDVTVAVWGEGDDDETLVPAARLFDARTGEEVRRFLGPARGFAFVAPWLVAFDEERGAAAWDPATGERVAVDTTLRPIASHPASGELVSIDGDALRVTRVVDAGARGE